VIKQECVLIQIDAGEAGIIAENSWCSNIHKFLLNRFTRRKQQGSSLNNLDVGCSVLIEIVRSKHRSGLENNGVYVVGSRIEHKLFRCVFGIVAR
jgi:hypothetical protein